MRSVLYGGVTCFRDSSPLHAYSYLASFVFPCVICSPLRHLFSFSLIFVIRSGWRAHAVSTRIDATVQTSSLGFTGFYFHEVQTISTPMASAWSIVRDPATCQDNPLLALSSMLPGSQALTIYNVTDSQLVGGPFPGERGRG